MAYDFDICINQGGKFMHLNLKEGSHKHYVYLFVKQEHNVVTIVSQLIFLMQPLRICVFMK